LGEDDKGRADLTFVNPGKKMKLNKSAQVGELVLCRFVAKQGSRGVTVQINERSFGFIDITEISDDFIGGTDCLNLAKELGVFTARVISMNDKNGKPDLSMRNSVLLHWNKALGP
jgi:predicted RNA-binding protein with RPS1 domain